MKNIKIIKTKDIPTRSKYLECRCDYKANRFDLYCVGKVIHMQCVLCNETYQLIDKQDKVKKKILNKIIKKKKSLLKSKTSKKKVFYKKSKLK